MSNTKKLLEKVAWLKKEYPNYHNINPYMDISLIDEIKIRLCKDGLLKSEWRYVADSAIRNIILTAQGKFIPKMERKCIGMN